MYKNLLSPLLLLIVLPFTAAAGPVKPARSAIYEIRTYWYTDSSQENRIDQYLKDALLPALHRAGLKKTGVFKPVGNDTATNKKIYILLTYPSMNGITSVKKKLAKDAVYLRAAATYLNSSFRKPAYLRMESVLLSSFAMAPKPAGSELTTAAEEKVYELRSYESASELYHANKLKMFTDGGEIEIFNRLRFNPVFYGSVISGSRMPNLMYMTSFQNREARDEHWKEFATDASWSSLAASSEYQNNVSHIDIVLLHPTSYSEI